MRALIEIDLALDMLDEIADGDLSFRNFNAGEIDLRSVSLTRSHRTSRGRDRH